MSTNWEVVVIGAGAAGLLAAARAAERGRRVLLLEKNRQAGVKILMSGGTRCNLTHAVASRGIVEAFGRQGKFLHSALAALSPQQLVALFEAEGVATKVEPGGKIFPVSDKASDVLDALLNRLQRSGAMLSLGEGVTGIERGPDGSFLVETAHRQLSAAKIVLTTGGRSYPGCGTAGDGYAWAERLGHTIVSTCPALTPVTIRADWAKALRGVTLPDAVVRVRLDDEAAAAAPKRERVLHERRGAMLFAHFGLSGPAVLDVSRAVSQSPRPRSLVLECDFLPDQNAAALEERWRQLAAQSGKRRVAAVVAEWLPRRLAEALVLQAETPLERTCAELSKLERQRLTKAVKAMAFPVTGVMGFKKAEVTAGGVSLDEVDSRSMESKRTPNLYIAGEVLDLDGPIGGYNFQAAFSTGWLAAEHV